MGSKTIDKFCDLQENVKIVKENIRKILDYKHYLGHHWLESSEYELESFSDDELLMFLLILDGTSFSYWGEPNWKIDYGGEKVNGARAMILSLRNAVKKGLLGLDAEFLSKIEREDYREILAGDVEIPLFEERYQIIKSIGLVLLADYNGRVTDLIKSAEGDAVRLVQILIDKFYFFEDYSDFEGERIYFNKKAQLFVLDVYRLYGGKGFGKLSRVNMLTACADYKLPQVLRRLGIFEYSEELSNRIDAKVTLPQNSCEEIEIRLKTIRAVELIRKELGMILKRSVSIHEVNELLWLIGQEKNEKDRPYHRVRTIRY